MKIRVKENGTDNRGSKVVGVRQTGQRQLYENRARRRGCKSRVNHVTSFHFKKVPCVLYIMKHCTFK